MIRVSPISISSEKFHQIELVSAVTFDTIPDLVDLRKRFVQHIPEYQKINNIKLNAEIVHKQISLIKTDPVYAFGECIANECIFSAHRNDLRALLEYYASMVSCNFASKTTITYVSYYPGQMLTDVIIINSIIKQNPHLREIHYHQLMCADSKIVEALINPIPRSNSTSGSNHTGGSVERREAFYYLQQYRYAYLLSLFRTLIPVFNVYLHHTTITIAVIAADCIVGIDHTDEHYTFPDIFHGVVFQCQRVGTVIINMFKYMDDVRDYLSGNFHLSIKICTDPGSRIGTRTVVELDSKNEYKSIYYAWTACRSAINRLVFGQC